MVGGKDSTFAPGIRDATAANSQPTGITIDPANVSDILVVDAGTDRVYQYAGAASRTSESQAAMASFALAAGNTNPQGIADPPANIAGQTVSPGSSQALKPSARTAFIPLVIAGDKPTRDIDRAFKRHMSKNEGSYSHLQRAVGVEAGTVDRYAREDAFYTMPASAASTFDIAAHDSAFDDLESDLIHFSSFELDGRGHD